MTPLAEFKFACPVCHQHIMAAVTSAGAQIECPTCFQQILVPRAPGGDTTKLILRGTKAASKPQTRFQPSKPGHKSPSLPALLATLGAVSLLVVGLVFFATSLSKLNDRVQSNPPSIFMGQAIDH